MRQRIGGEAKAPAKLPRLCAYCGKRPANTKDHVVPRCLFPGNLPANVLTVRVCLQCNREKSRDEDYFRDCLTMDIRSSQSANAQSVFNGKVLKSMGHRSCELAKDAALMWTIRPMRTKSGVVLGMKPSVPIAAGRVTRVLKFMLKGLYYRIEGKRLPDSCTVHVKSVDWFGLKPLWRSFHEKGAAGPYGYNGIFVCSYVRAAELEHATYWLFVFYDSIAFTIYTEPPVTDH